MNLPLVERELLRAGRRESTYAARAFVPALSLLFLAPSFMSQTFFRGETVREVLAENLFGLAEIGQWFIASFVVAWLGARAIADEARDDTLDLVTLADKSHGEYFASKFVSVWVQALALLVGIVPLQVVAGFLGGVAGDSVFPGLARAAVSAALVCAVSLFLSALFKRAGWAFLGMLVGLLVWSNVRRAIHDVTPPMLAMPVIVGTQIAVSAASVWGTLALLRHPDFNLFHMGRRRRRPAAIPSSPAACVARIVQYERGGIATFAQSWWGRAIAAALLALFAYGTEMPIGAWLGMLIAVEAYVVGLQLRRRAIFADLSLTTAGPQDIMKGVLRGQFINALVFAPALILTIELPARYQELGWLAQRIETYATNPTPLTSAPITVAVMAAVAVAYAVLVIYFYSAAGILYAIMPWSTLKSILRILGLAIIVPLLVTMLNAVFALVAQQLTGPLVTPPPQPLYGETIGELLAALVILPLLVVDFTNRIASALARVPEED